MAKTSKWITRAKKEVLGILVDRKQFNSREDKAVWDAYQRGYLEKAKKDEEIISFLLELHDKLHKGAQTSSGWGSTYYIMWNDTECVGDVMRRLIGLPKLKEGE